MAIEIEFPTYRESHLRSIIKGLTYRVIGTLATAGVAYFFTGDISSAIKIGAMEFFLKMFIYYGHERIWQMVPRGTVRKIYQNKA